MFHRNLLSIVNYFDIVSTFSVVSDGEMSTAAARMHYRLGLKLPLDSLIHNFHRSYVEIHHMSVNVQKLFDCFILAASSFIKGLKFGRFLRKGSPST